MTKDDRTTLVAFVAICVALAGAASTQKSVVQVDPPDLILSVQSNDARVLAWIDERARLLCGNSVDGGIVCFDHETTDAIAVGMHLFGWDAGHQ